MKSGRRRHSDQQHGTLQRLCYSVGQPGRRPDQRSLTGIPQFLSHNHPRLSRDDQIKFVRPGMSVDLLGLSGLKAVQPYEQPGACKEVEFGGMFG